MENRICILSINGAGNILWQGQGVHADTGARLDALAVLAETEAGT